MTLTPGGSGGGGNSPLLLFVEFFLAMIENLAAWLGFFFEIILLELVFIAALGLAGRAIFVRLPSFILRLEQKALGNFRDHA